MKWYWKVKGGHTHVRVFMNGAKCGNLCFTHKEFGQVMDCCPWIQFIEDTGGAALNLAGEILIPVEAPDGCNASIRDGIGVATCGSVVVGRDGKPWRYYCAQCSPATLPLFAENGGGL